MVALPKTHESIIQGRCAPLELPVGLSLDHETTTAFYAIHSALESYVTWPRCPNRIAFVDACFELWWNRACAVGVPLGPVYRMLCEPTVHKSLDQLFRRRNGWAKKTIRTALTLWPTEVFQRAQGGASEHL